MRPIEFELSNVVYAKDQPEYLPLPAYVTPDGQEATACWGMGWRERIRVLLTGRVYVTLLTFGGPLTPSRVSTEPPQLPPAECANGCPSNQACDYCAGGR